MKMQDEFYQVAQEHSGRIGVPMPFYAVEIASHKVLAMEKLNAASIDDILGGKALLPEWIDVDELYNELKSMVGSFHDKGLFHRDMHFGNIMISQSRDAQNAEKLGYIIDFGLSAHASEEMEPYRKESAGSTFTYNNDYVILEEARIQLNALRRRNI
jgi:tRNA A-37 threonylcarbamoyl transferase component Bud32